MIINLNDKKLQVYWLHPSKNDEFDIFNMKQVCRCYVIDYNTKTVVSSGRSYCSKSDHYVKKIGRKISFQRAIEHMPRETRKEIWNNIKTTNQLNVFV